MTSVSDVDKARLEAAREQIQKLMQRDAKVKDESDLYNKLIKQARTNEGCMYEACESDAPLHKQPQFVAAPGGFTAMPAALKQAATDQLEYHMFVGLFPELHRAWMTIDHMLFIWDYNEPRGAFYQYDGLDQTIINASLVPCRPGVFASEGTPTYLLLLSTPSEVLVLAVYATGPPGMEDASIDVHETGFSVSSDGVNLVATAATPTGRVFMGGADGFLYELTYGHVDGWWGGTTRACAKRNRSRKRDRAYQFVMTALYQSSDPIVNLMLDSERNILYSLTASSTLAVYDLGSSGDSLHYVAAMDVRTIHGRLRHHGAVPGDSKTLQRLDEDLRAAEKASATSRELAPAIVSLSPVPASVSSLMQLILVSASGVRVVVRVSPNTADGRRAPPSEIRPLFAVAPPRASDGRPLRCSRGAALCAADSLLVASSVEDAHASVELMCVSDLLAARAEDGSPRSDAASLTRLKLHGSLYAVAQEPLPGPPGLGSQLAAQFSTPPSAFVLLTSEGVLRVLKRRPVDALLAAASPHHAAALPLGMPSPAADFFAFYGAEEAACMCLLGALSAGADSPAAERLAGWAHAYGGVATEQVATALPEVSATAQGAVILGQAPRFSGRHGGVYRAAARLLHEAWLAPLCALARPATGGLTLRRPRAFWLRLHSDLVGMLAHLHAHAREWGVPPDAATPPATIAAPPAARMSGGYGANGYGGGLAADGMHARLRASVGGLVFSERAAAEARWGAMHGAPDREAESLAGVLGLVRRVAQLALLLASLAEPDVPPGPNNSALGIAGGGDGSGAPALMERVSMALPAKLYGLLRDGLSLQALAVPLRLDARGKPVPGSWDAEVDTRLPKALFMGLGQVEAAGGAQVTARLRCECPDLFSSSDATSLHGWDLLSRAAAATTAEADRGPLLTEALATFLPVAATDASLDLDALLSAFFEHHAHAYRAPQAAAPAAARSPATAAAERAIAQLPLAAARAVDPSGLAASALTPTGAEGGIDGWSARQRAAICGRLKCYRLLLDKLQLLQRAPLPAGVGAPAAAGGGGQGMVACGGVPGEGSGGVSGVASLSSPGGGAAAGSGWKAVLYAALRYAPEDGLFLQAAAWWLLEAGRDDTLLSLPSPHLEVFCAAAPPPDALRRVWAAFTSPKAADALDSWEALVATPEPAGMTEAVSKLSRGYLLPRLYLNQERHVEAASAFLNQAVRAAAPAPGGASGFAYVSRRLQERISAFSLAVTAAKAAGADGAARLGADFIREASDQAQLGQLQLKVASDMADLARADPSDESGPLVRLAHARGVEPPVLARELMSRAQATCSSLLELDALFSLAWECELWGAALAILDFATPHSQHPEHVDLALNKLLFPPRSTRQQWEETRAAVVTLRKNHPSGYIFNLDTLCALLERRALANGQPAVAVIDLISPAAGALRPPVAWGELYRCYAGARHAGRHMKVLWEEEATQLRLLEALVHLLQAWLRIASSSAVEMRALVSVQRELAIVADLDAHVVRLGGDFASRAATQPQLAARLRAELRDLRAAISAHSSRS